jgi:hypothetical protein
MRFWLLVVTAIILLFGLAVSVLLVSIIPVVERPEVIETVVATLPTTHTSITPPVLHSYSCHGVIYYVIDGMR